MEYTKHNHAIKVLKMMSNSNRLKVLELLWRADAPINVGDIAAKLGIEVSNLSNHLFKLRAVGLVKAKQHGSNMYYSIKDPLVERFLKSI